MAKYGRFKYGQAKYGSDSPLWVTVRNHADLTNNTDYAYINYTDLNRIETRIKELSDMLNELGITNTISINVWYEQSEDNLPDNLPVPEKMEKLINNINTIFELIKANYDNFNFENICPVSMKYLDINLMNNMEILLYTMYNFLKEWFCGF